MRRDADDATHQFACWYPVGTPEWSEARDRNLADGRTAAGTALSAAAVAEVQEVGGLMAGTGTAHLRDDADVVLRVEDLVVEFPVGRRAPCTPCPTSASTSSAARRSGSSASPAAASRRPGGRSCSCRRPTVGHGPVRRRRPRHAAQATSCAAYAAQVQMIFQDPISSLNPRRTIVDIVGDPLVVWGEGKDRRDRVAEILDAVGLDADAGRRAAAAPVLRRPVPAHLDRPRARARPGDPDLRRAGVGARRVGAGADPQPAGGDEGALRPDPGLHRPRPRRRPQHQRPRRRDVPRQDLRGRRLARRSTPPRRTRTPTLLLASIPSVPTRRRADAAAAARCPRRSSPPTGAASAPAARGRTTRCAADEPHAAARHRRATSSPATTRSSSRSVRRRTRGGHVMPMPRRPARCAGLRVVDQADEKGELCGRLLADLGADVVRVEPPGGADVAAPRPVPRRRTACTSPSATPTSARLGSTSTTTADRDALLGAARRRRHLDRVGAPGHARRRRPRPRRGGRPASRSSWSSSITDFGQTGPYRDYVATDAVMVAHGVDAVPGRCARAAAGAAAGRRSPTTSPAITAAFAALTGLVQRLRTGRGQHIDLSVMEAVAQTTDWGLASYSVMERQMGTDEPDPQRRRADLPDRAVQGRMGATLDRHQGRVAQDARLARRAGDAAGRALRRHRPASRSTTT